MIDIENYPACGCTIPAPPVATGASCTSSASLTATGCTSTGQTLSWYKTSDNSSVTMPQGVGTYYAKCASGTCVSEKSNDVNITNTTPSAPALTGVTCTSSATPTYTGCTGGTVLWYKSDGTSVTMPQGEGTYYAKCKSSDNCVSSASNSVNITGPARVPTISGATSRCVSSNDEIELIALGCNDAVTWQPEGSTNSIKVKPTISTNYRANCTENGCTGDWSLDHTITVVAPPDAPSITGDNLICPNTSTTLNVTNCSGTGYSVLWSTGETTPSIVVSPAVQTEYKATCTKNGCTSGEGSKTVSIKATTNPNIGPSSAYICSDGSKNFTIASGVCEINSIFWKKDGTTIPNQTSATLSNVSEPGVYTAICSNNGCGVSKSAQLNKAPAVSSTILQSSPYYICEGSNLTLQASDPGTGSSFAWTAVGYSSNSNPVTRNYVAGQSLAGTYTLNISRNFPEMGDITCGGASSTIEVRITTPSVGGSISPSNYNICESEGLPANAFSISGNTGNIIRWEKKLASATTWTNCGGTAASSCTFTTAGDWRIRAIVQNGVCAEVASTEGSVNVVPEATISIGPENPFSTTICSVGTTVLYASVANGLGCTISWEFKNLPGDATADDPWVRVAIGDGNNRIPTGALIANRTYRAIYSCSGINCNPKTYSDPLTVTVNQPINGTADGSEVCAGETISITSSGGDTYQWNGPNSYASDQANNTIPNSTSANTGTYTVVISRLGCPSVTKTATVNVKPLPVVTATCPNCVTAVTDGCTILTTGSPKQGDTNFELRSTVSNGTSTYSWKGPNSFVSNLQNPTIPTFSTPPTKVESNMTGVYTVTPTLSNGCTATSTVSVTVVSSCNLTFKGGFPKTTCNNFKGNILVEMCGQATGKTLEYKLEIKDDNGNFVIVSNWNVNASTLTNLPDGTYRVRVRERGSGDGYGSSGNNSICDAGVREVTIKNAIKCEDIVLKATTQAGIATNEITVKADGTTSKINLTADISAVLPTATATCPNPTATYFWTGPNGFTANIKDIEVRIPGVYKVKITFTQGGSTNFECNLEKELTMNYTPLPIDPAFVQVRCIGNKSYAWVTSGTGIMTKPEFSIDLENWTTYYDFELIGGIAGDKFKIFVRDGNATSKVKLMAEVVKTSCDCGLAAGSFFAANLPVIECAANGTSTTSLLAYKYNGSTYDYNFEYKLKKDGAFIIPDWTATSSWTVLPYALLPGNYTFFAKNGLCEASVDFTIKPATTVSAPNYGCNLQLTAEATLDASLNRKVSVKNQDSWSGNGLWFDGRYTDASISNAASHQDIKNTSKKFTFETWINPDNQQNIKLFTPSETASQNAGSGLFYQKQHYLAISGAESGMNGFGLSVGGNGVNLIEYHTNGNVNIIKSLPYSFTG